MTALVSSDECIESLPITYSTGITRPGAGSICELGNNNYNDEDSFIR